MSLTDYRTLGRSGLIVSPLALGTMTFGTPNWGTDRATSADILDAYVEVGGNFLDTADVYSGGKSEEMIGELVADRKLRDQLVIATKFGFGAAPGNPNAGGNGRKQIYRAIEGSLRRLKTDYIDLYWLHVWDTVTPAAEVLQTLGDLVRAGKIRYFGLSDMPAWYAARMATLAETINVPGPIALQLEHSLVERTIEREHLPAARHMGMSVMPWSPLAGGFLAGKYQRSAAGTETETSSGRLSTSNPFSGPFTKFTDRNWTILEELRSVAAEVDRTPAQVALAWVTGRRGVGSTLVGASRVSQLQENIAALNAVLSADQLARLDCVSAPEDTFPYPIFEAGINRGGVFNGVSVMPFDAMP